MRRYSLYLIAAALLGAANISAAPLVLTPNGYGAVKFGMTPAQVEAALKAKLTLDNSASGSGRCVDGGIGDPFQPPFTYSFIDGKLATISLFKTEISAGKGIKLGDPATKVRSAYGKAVQDKPNIYDNGRYRELFVWEASGRGLNFSVNDKGVVTGIQAGTKQITSPEGCAGG